MDLKVSRDHKDLKVSLDHKGFRDHKDLKVPKEMLVYVVIRDFRDQKD